MTRLASWIERLHLALGSLSGVATIAMIALVLPDVILRKFFSATIPGASEANILLLVIMVYLGLAGAQARGAHFRVTLLTDRLPEGVVRGLEALMLLLALGGFGLLAWMTTENAAASFARGEASFGVIAFPLWPGRMAVALGLWLLCLQFVVDLLRLALNAPRAREEHDVA
ncbi:MAG: TRAP transporter small permease [Pseudomonadota bacterium]